MSEVNRETLLAVKAEAGRQVSRIYDCIPQAHTHDWIALVTLIDDVLANVDAKPMLYSNLCLKLHECPCPTCKQEALRSHQDGSPRLCCEVCESVFPLAALEKYVGLNG